MAQAGHQLPLSGARPGGEGSGYVTKVVKVEIVPADFVTLATPMLVEGGGGEETAVLGGELWRVRVVVEADVLRDGVDHQLWQRATTRRLASVLGSVTSRRPPPKFTTCSATVTVPASRSTWCSRRASNSAAQAAEAGEQDHGAPSRPDGIG